MEPATHSIGVHRRSKAEPMTGSSVEKLEMVSTRSASMGRFLPVGTVHRVRTCRGTGVPFRPSGDPDGKITGMGPCLPHVTDLHKGRSPPSGPHPRPFWTRDLVLLET